MQSDKTPRKRTAELLEYLAEYTHDPLKFVYAAFPWGEGELGDCSGPDAWQREVLTDIGAGVKDISTVTREAVASGNGIGKSALVAWLILWAISTHEDTRGVVTANTEVQLRTKTWAELAKWHRLFIARDAFRYTATSIFSAQDGHDKTWRIDAIPWSKENPEAFAGLHNQGKRILIIFDEASAIYDGIWEVTEGAVTDADTEIIWSVFGNPTRNQGRFFECFNEYGCFWKQKQIDSRTAKISNKAQIKEWQEQYGEDSDFFKVHVRGVFPDASDTQLIPRALVDAAMRREVLERDVRGSPIVMGVDVARFGDDNTAIWRRQGLWADKPLVFHGLDAMQCADQIIMAIKRWKADICFIDAGGLGGPVYDYLNRLGYTNIVPVNFGSQAMSPTQFANLRAEMYFKLKSWLEDGGALPYEPKLKQELAAAEYMFTLAGKIQLEPKEKIKEKLGRSPDLSDGLALTFARPYLKPSPLMADYGGGRQEYDPLAGM